MRTILVSYDLIAEESSSDYSSLIQLIKSYPNWVKPLESFWLIRTTDGVAAVRDALKTKMDSNDKLVVIEVTGQLWSSYGISREASDWFQAYL